MKRLELQLIVRSTENPATVAFAVCDAQGNPGLIGEFPKLDGPPVNTVRAIVDLLAELFGLALTGEPEAGTAPARRANAWLN